MLKKALIIIVIISITKPLFSKAPPVVLKDSKDYYEIGLNLDILEDPKGKLTIYDVNSPKWSSKFKKSHVKIPNFGLSSSAYWARFTIRNESKNNY